MQPQPAEEAAPEAEPENAPLAEPAPQDEISQTELEQRLTNQALEIETQQEEQTAASTGSEEDN